MSGAREAAFDFILPRIVHTWRILDVGAGRSPLAGMLAIKGCSVTAIDVDHDALLDSWRTSHARYEIKRCDVRSFAYRNMFDAAMAIYSLQHMIAYEPLAWVKIREALKDRGKFFYVGRYRPDSPAYEGNRRDPLFSGNEGTINCLATLSGFKVKEFTLYHYDSNVFEKTTDDSVANAFGAAMEAA